MAERLPPPPEVQGFPPWAAWLVATMVVVLLVTTFRDGDLRPARPEIPYTELKSLVRADQVDRVELLGDVIEGELESERTLAPDGRIGRTFRTRIPAIGDDELLPLLEAHEVAVIVAEPSDSGWAVIARELLFWLFLVVVVLWIYRRSTRTLTRLTGPGEVAPFLHRGAEQATVPDVTFDDVAGQESAKREVTELVEYLKEPERFLKLGAEVPRGVLLMGPPGTGKTLMARALAGQAGVPFFSISGSEFIEVFVGVGAARVRNLFRSAKDRSPSIIFIDELDSVGRTRGTGFGGGHDEREQTLNQILAEMDGFAGHEAVIVVAATNRPDVLDPALLRPGRFDRHVVLDLPDRAGRLAILKVHTRKVPLSPAVDLETLAEGTSGFSGADLKNLVNEAAIAAARQRQQMVGMEDFEEARDKLLLGTVRTLAIQPSERHRLAVHESGHTLVAWHLPDSDPLYKVTIIPRGRTLGSTHQLPEHERHTLPEDYLRNRLAVMLAGRTAEKELLGSVSTGAEDDIKEATGLARSMVASWGMNAEVGPVDLSNGDDHPFLGRQMAQPRHYSEHAARAVDEAVAQLLTEAVARATDVIRSHRDRLEKLIAELEKHETLHHGQLESVLGNRKPRLTATGT